MDEGMSVVGLPAPSARLRDVGGQVVNLADLWQKQPLLLFFLRHAGCALCRSHLRVLGQAAPQLQAAGLAVVAITFSDPASTAYVQRTQAVPFPILLDPDRTVYRQYGMVEGTMGDALSPRILIQQLRQLRHGQLAYVPFGANLRQLGGSVVVDTAGRIRLHHVALPIDAYPTIPDYLAAITPQ